MLHLKPYTFCIVTQFRQFALTQLSKKNHYDTLGITPNATLNDIKKAYYNLSMIYHPDKSQGNSESLEKFRAVTEAYECLSNLTSKRLYDKGVLHQAPLNTNRPKPRKKSVIIPEGRTPIYNFDLWSKNHYGDSILRRAATKQRYDDRASRRKSDLDERRVAVFLFWMGLILFSSYLLTELSSPNEDIPLEKSRD